MSEPELSSWIGRQEERQDNISLASAKALAATLNWQNESLNAMSLGQPLPKPWHWLYFLPTPPMSEIDVDGHPHRGGFLPAVSLPRRMWASSQIQFISPLHIGDNTVRSSCIKEIKSKKGASGELVFVTVSHQIHVIDPSTQHKKIVIEEEQNIVYREEPKTKKTTSSTQTKVVSSPPALAQWSDTITPDPVLLFRYSALTFNAHRIHYDRPYATEIEGYQGLVVQGPLTATLLLNSLHQHHPDVELASFSFRGLKPLTDVTQFKLEGHRDGNHVLLWALDSSGDVAMRAEANLR